MISNFDERLPKLLEALGIADYFDIIITSKVSKPLAQALLQALIRVLVIEFRV